MGKPKDQADYEARIPSADRERIDMLRSLLKAQIRGERINSIEELHGNSVVDALRKMGAGR
jgi:hypothetical protein